MANENGGGVAVTAEGELYVDDGVSLGAGANKLGLHFRNYDEGGDGIVEITEATERFLAFSNGTKDDMASRCKF